MINIATYWRSQVHTSFNMQPIYLAYFRYITINMLFYFQVIDNYVGGRGIISEKEANGSTVSNIYVGAATIQDTGNYTCEAPALATNASVNLHVLVDGNTQNVTQVFLELRSTFLQSNVNLVRPLEYSRFLG